MSNQTDYRKVVIPDDKDPTDYHYTERRASILETIEEKGHPQAITQRELADHYGVSQTQIWKDIDRLKDFYQQSLGAHSKFTSEMVYRKAIKAHVDRGEYDKAVEAVESWNEWLWDMGVNDKEPDKAEIDMDADHSVRNLPDETKELFAEWAGQTPDSE